MSRLIGDAPFTQEEREALIQHARTFIGKPWKHQGRRDAGADCIGWVWMFIQGVRQAPTPRIDYGRTPSLGKLRAGLIEYLGLPVQGPPTPGDIVTLVWKSEEQHLALVTPHPAYGVGLLHADNHAPGLQGPRVVEHGIDRYWRRRITGVWRP